MYRLRQGRGRGVVVGCILAALCLGLYSSRAPAAAKADKPDPYRRIAVLPFKNLHDEWDINWFVEGAWRALTDKLEQIPPLAVAEPSRVWDAIIAKRIDTDKAADPKVAAQAGKALGVERVVFVACTRIDDKFSFRLTVVSTAGSVVLATAKFNGAGKEVFRAMSDLAKAVVRSYDKIGAAGKVAAAPAARRVPVTGAINRTLADWGTTNPDAFDALCSCLWRLCCRCLRCNWGAYGA